MGKSIVFKMPHRYKKSSKIIGDYRFPKKILKKKIQDQLDILRTIASDDYDHSNTPRIDYAEMYLENLSFLLFGKCPSRQKESVQKIFFKFHIQLRIIIIHIGQICS